jgi:hypothetical protein
MIRHNITLEPASRRISATCVLIAVLNAAQTLNFIVLTSSVIILGGAEEPPGLPEP